METAAEFNQRQYRLMAARIRLFEEGRLAYSLLVGELYSLVNILESPDRAWRHEFLYEWELLDVEWAFADHHRYTITFANAEPKIRAAIAQLKSLVQRKLDEAADPAQT